MLQELGRHYRAPLDDASKRFETDKQLSAVRSAAKALAGKAAARIPPARGEQLRTAILQHFGRENQLWPGSASEQQQLLQAALAVEVKSIAKGWQPHAARVVAGVLAEGEQIQQQQEPRQRQQTQQQLQQQQGCQDHTYGAMTSDSCPPADKQQSTQQHLAQPSSAAAAAGVHSTAGVAPAVLSAALACAVGTGAAAAAASASALGLQDAVHGALRAICSSEQQQQQQQQQGHTLLPQPLPQHQHVQLQQQQVRRQQQQYSQGSSLSEQQQQQQQYSHGSTLREQQHHHQQQQQQYGQGSSLSEQEGPKVTLAGRVGMPSSVAAAASHGFHTLLLAIAAAGCVSGPTNSTYGQPGATQPLLMPAALATVAGQGCSTAGTAVVAEKATATTAASAAKDTTVPAAAVVGAVPQLSAAGESALEEFVKGWRRHFLETMQPQYLPPFWSVDSRVKNSSAPAPGQVASTAAAAGGAGAGTGPSQHTSLS
jgi:hypothetical protein